MNMGYSAESGSNIRAMTLLIDTKQENCHACLMIRKNTILMGFTFNRVINKFNPGKQFPASMDQY